MSDSKKETPYPTYYQRKIISEYENMSKDVSLINDGCKFLSITIDKEILKKYGDKCVAIIFLELTAVHPSIYQGKKYLVDIVCSSSYPFLPPTVIFKTSIDHINICDISGKVIHSFLRDDWAPFGLRPVVIEILQLFTTPRPQDLIF